MKRLPVAVFALFLTSAFWGSVGDSSPLTLALEIATPAEALAQQRPPPAAPRDRAGQSDGETPSEAGEPTGTEESSARHAALFEPLDLPEPNEFRTAAGSPGEGYWQQRADYRIEVTLDPDDHQITGGLTIGYTNNSPDSLRSLWLQLDQNVFRPDSRGAARAEEMQDERFTGAFDDGGFKIASVVITQDGASSEVQIAGPVTAALPRPVRAEYHIDDTMMEIRLEEPVPPGGGQVEISIDYAFTIPVSGADRMGRLKVKQGTIYEIAQWYPRMFVYDDVNGWNVMPYLGQGEFYLEYGDFDVEITVPRDFIVLATGELQNPQDVLTPEQRQRLAAALTSTNTVPIIAREEVGKDETRPAGEGPLTWKFRADNVRDFAWAASQAFIWDAAGWSGVLLMSAYPQEGLGARGISGWERSTEYLVHAVAHYSRKWYPYPYPVAINVAGTALGMEYPMIVFCSVQARGFGLFLVTDHEVGHAWFPMLVGSDERRFAWMDEGFTTFMNHYSQLEFGNDWPADPITPQNIARSLASEQAEHPIMTLPDELSQDELGLLAYYKPASVLLLLREYVLDQELFDAAFQRYIEEWAGKHPQPADFFRTVEDVSGEDLSWFWRSWVLEPGFLDVSVKSVRSEGGGSTVVIQNGGDVVMPIEVRFVFTDGTDECRQIPVDVWREGELYTVELPGKQVRQVQIDPRGMLPDSKRSNNVRGQGIILRQDRC